MESTKKKALLGHGPGFPSCMPDRDTKLIFQAPFLTLRGLPPTWVPHVFKPHQGTPCIYALDLVNDRRQQWDWLSLETSGYK